MHCKFDLSTIVSLIDLLERFDAAGKRQSPVQFVRENFCTRKLSDANHLEMELFANICRYRNFIEFMLKTKFAAANIPLIVHLYLMMFFMSKSTSAVIFESLQKKFADEVIKDLICLIDDEQFAATLRQKEERKVNKAAVLGSSKEVCSRFYNINPIYFTTFYRSKRLR